MRNVLYILGPSSNFCRIILDQNLKIRNKYKKIIILTDPWKLKGLHAKDIDIFITEGWWNKEKSGKILDEIICFKKQSIHNSINIIGDKKYIPPFIYENNFKRTNRFEILDI